MANQAAVCRWCEPANFVDNSKWKEQTAELECVHGDSISYPTAQVTLKINSWTKEISAAVVPKLPVDFLVSGKDYTSSADSRRNIGRHKVSKTKTDGTV